MESRAVIGPDATGAGWVYEYLLINCSHNLNLADLRSLQDWHVRYELETVPGVAEVSTIGRARRISGAPDSMAVRAVGCKPLSGSRNGV